MAFFATLAPARPGRRCAGPTPAAGAARPVARPAWTAAALTGAGLVRRIQPAGSLARYELRVGDNHHHVVCRDCGDIADVDCAVGHRPCLTASDSSGFVIDEAEVTYWGLCSRCSTTTHPSDEGAQRV